jgi:hypothetical protein
MGANTKPIFSGKPASGWGTIATFNTAKDGTGTVVTVFTADATEGSYVEKLIVRAMGSNVATVMRVWLNNGSTNATPANNTMIAEITLPLTSNSEVAKLPDYEIPVGFGIKPGYKINVTLGTTVAAGFHVTAIGGDYTINP